MRPCTKHAIAVESREMRMDLNEIIDLETFPIDDAEFRAACKKQFEDAGVFVMPGFVRKNAIDTVRDEGIANNDTAPTL